MTNNLLTLNNIFSSQILFKDENFLLAYKAPCIHSVSGKDINSDNLINSLRPAYSDDNFPVNDILKDRGLMHRLDFETHGLLLIARNMMTMNSLLTQQKEGKIIKLYSAFISESKSETPLLGFPKTDHKNNKIIESAFRAYGPGRKSVRPAILNESGKKKISLDNGSPYITELLNENKIKDAGENNITAIKIKLLRGFRHQIRAHLAWKGKPIINDSLYGGSPYGNKLMALRAFSLSFLDPASDNRLSFSIPELSIKDLELEWL